MKLKKKLLCIAELYLMAYFHGEAEMKAKKPHQYFLRKIQFPNETCHL